MCFKDVLAFCFFFSCPTLSKTTTVFAAESDTKVPEPDVEAPPRPGIVVLNLFAAQDVTKLSSFVGKERNDIDNL